tara:strand:- start:11 stop:223 length:213 start_codon:yes stop_codon:yes gene_type:complete
MKTQIKENLLSIAVKNDMPDIKKIRQKRPNIENLIKRIVTEKRKEERKNYLIFGLVLLTASILIMFTLYY